jgi:hypothetical protein
VAEFLDQHWSVDESFRIRQLFVIVILKSQEAKIAALKAQLAVMQRLEDRINTLEVSKLILENGVSVVESRNQSN